MSSQRAHLAREIESCSICIPDDLAFEFSPALSCLEEWRDHWLDLPGVRRLRVGRQWLEPIRGSLFNLRFENHLGLAQVQSFSDEKPLCPPITVEVISPKFCSPYHHIAFFSSLLDDLCARGARLPFDLVGATERGVKEALQPSTPLFVLHFLSQHGAQLQSALAMVEARPHRCLTYKAEHVALADAAQADADVLQDIFRSSERWVQADLVLLLARRLDGYAPTTVLQQLSMESLDTPENRFVHHFLRQLLVAAERLLAQRWWTKVPIRRRQRVRGVIDRLHRAYYHPMFDDIGPMRYLPLNSQILLRREGYRTLLDLWRSFHQARRPLFARFQEAIDIRDIATLYEIWVFFALIDEIRLALEGDPQIGVQTTAEQGLAWRAEARFPGAGTLVYNRGFRKKSYSVLLRPDFSWIEQGRPRVVLDAKFRLERLPSADEDDSPSATAKRTDIYKMHTYRDALSGVRAAVALYPGTETLFYDKALGRLDDVTLKQILMSDVSGIGALPIKPLIEEA